MTQMTAMHLRTRASGAGMRRALIVAMGLASLGLGTLTADDAVPPLNAPASGERHPGKLIWGDLFSSKPDVSKRFYTRMFGWKATDLRLGEQEVSVFMLGERPMAGMVRRDRVAGDTADSRWVPYFSTKDVRALSRKITRAVARIATGLQQQLFLGNLGAKRDWGHAKDYVEGMWRILQHDEPDDFVLATGRTVTVRDFVNMAFTAAGMEIAWKGNGEGETGFESKTGRTLVAVDPRYYRPTEVELLVGDATKAREKLGWTPTYTLEEMVQEMVQRDLETARRKGR